MKKTLALFLAALAFAGYGCGGPKDHTSTAETTGHSETKVLQHPDWSKNATIYEVNVRQHTAQGTFAALEQDLPRLDSMGVDILWLMPIYPIGELNRKGSLGSYYSVKNYVGVNPEFGTMDDFKHFVNNAHNRGMKVILDWVANHTAWDHPWVTEHPDWYSHDTSGAIVPPVPDWSDVADLNFDNSGLRHAMTESMKFWVKNCDVDGFRCDVAMMVPTDFWNNTRASLDSLKPVFMLAEADMPEHHLKAFDMSYSWDLLNSMNKIAKGEKKLDEIDAYLHRQDSAYLKSAYRMTFTTNHDENTWNGTGGERYGAARPVYDVLAFTIGGMPLVYSGQEGGEHNSQGKEHRLRFFDKDTVQWHGYANQDMYARLFKAHHENPALWNGEFGGPVKRLKTSSDDVLYCFTRQKDGNEVVVLLNFSDKPQKVDFVDDVTQTELHSIFNNQLFSIYSKGGVPLPAHGYQVFVK